MSDNITEVLKNKFDILEIIGERVKLKKAGRSFVGLCPFHHEDTPSFHVFPDSQNYYCFGCNRGGDIFTFIMQIDGLDFRQTIEMLAERAGISLKNIHSENDNHKSKNTYDVLNFAAKYFSDNLRKPEGSIAREYLKKRFLDSTDCKNFSLGYSPNSWDALTRTLKNSGFDEKQIIDAGLAIQNKNGGLYDRFRGRLIFPVKDFTGKIIAFGGRLVDGDGAKYINSPESQVYTKRNNLYLLNEARKFIRQPQQKRTILVEGYMDAIRLHKAGFKETVASLGTSLTPEQADLLSRFFDTCYICYDSDLAGQEATIRGMYILQEHGLDVRVINIPEGKDPDEFLCLNDANKFEELISSATPLVIQHLNSLKKQLQTPGQFRNAEKSLLEGLSRLRYPEIAPFNSKICAFLGLSPDELKYKLNTFSLNKNVNKKINQQSDDIKENFSDKENLLSIESALCALIWKYPEIRMTLTSQDILKALEKNNNICEIALAIFMCGSDEMNQRWLMTGETEALSLITRGEIFLQREFGKNKNNFLTPIQQWQNLTEMLTSFNDNKSVEEIKYKMLHGTASQDELTKLRDFLKGRK